jgi:hypothetical protein
MWLTRSKRLIGLLLLPGALFYVLYTYLVYLLAMPLNGFYLIYPSLIALTLYSLIGILSSIDSEVLRKKLMGRVWERVTGGVLTLFGVLFLVRVIFILAKAFIDKYPIEGVDVALLASDFFAAPIMFFGGVLLIRRRPFGYLAGLGLLFQACMLFIGLIAVLSLQPLIIGGEFMLVDIIVVALMGFVCFIPFALFVRGVLSI